MSSINTSYNSAIVASNVETLERAKVVVLLGVHPNDKDYEKQAAFNAKVIQDSYKPGDIILVEDCFKKAKESLFYQSEGTVDRYNRKSPYHACSSTTENQ